MAKSKKFKFIYLGLVPSMIEKLDFMADHFSESRSVVIRRAITDLFDDTQKKRFGYKGYAAVEMKAKQKEDEKNEVTLIEETIKKMENMSDPDLSKFIKEIGLIDPDTETDKAFVTTFRSGVRGVKTMSTGGMSQEWLTFDELIIKLKKEWSLLKLPK